MSNVKCLIFWHFFVLCENDFWVNFQTFSTNCSRELFFAYITYWKIDQIRPFFFQNFCFLCVLFSRSYGQTKRFSWTDCRKSLKIHLEVFFIKYKKKKIKQIKIFQTVRFDVECPIYKNNQIFIHKTWRTRCWYILYLFEKTHAY